MWIDFWTFREMVFLSVKYKVEYGSIKNYFKKHLSEEAIQEWGKVKFTFNLECYDGPLLTTLLSCWFAMEITDEDELFDTRGHDLNHVIKYLMLVVDIRPEWFIMPLEWVKLNEPDDKDKIIFQALDDLILVKNSDKLISQALKGANSDKLKDAVRTYSVKHLQKLTKERLLTLAEAKLPKSVKKDDLIIHILEEDLQNKLNFKTCESPIRSY